jgi:hypothetical protein
VNLSSLLGTRLTLWLGPGLAVPAPAPIVEALIGVEATQQARGRDVFQLTFSLGRPAPGIPDYPLLVNPLLRPGTRAIVQIWQGVVPQVLVDGFVTNQQVSTSNTPGGATLTVTCEDLGVLMDLHEVAIPYPQMSSDARVFLILARYSLFIGSPPVVFPAIPPDSSLAIELVPTQGETDLAYVEALARARDYVFYVETTPVPMVNIAYWGPENRLSIPQPALSVNLGGDTNVDYLSFGYDALSPAMVLGAFEEKHTRAPLPVATFASLRPPLAPLPALLVQQPFVRSVFPPDTSPTDPAQAFARAQALTDTSTDAVTAEGELDVARYGQLLRPRRLVGVRGAGFLYDGFWFVSRVTTRISRGQFKQSFSLVREGLGSLSPVVPT